jgi:hypothetical protein
MKEEFRQKFWDKHGQFLRENMGADTYYPLLDLVSQEFALSLAEHDLHLESVFLSLRRLIETGAQGKDVYVKLDDVLALLTKPEAEARE